MLDWRLTPASLGFKEFNPCHHPAGSPAGGQFCSTEGAPYSRVTGFDPTTTHTGLGIIRNGVVEVFDLKLGNPRDSLHKDAFGGGFIRPAQRFRYDYGTIDWDDRPDDEDLFVVEDYFAGKGWGVTRHRDLTYDKVFTSRSRAELPTAARRAANRVREFNPCHHPSGSPEGGQFCSAFVQTTAAAATPLFGNPSALSADQKAMAGRIGHVEVGLHATTVEGRPVVWIGHLESRPSRRGYGAAFMRRLTRQADTAGVTLALEPHPIEPAEGPSIPREKLVAFYTGFGFVPSGAGVMMRRPKQLR